MCLMIEAQGVSECCFHLLSLVFNRFSLIMQILWTACKHVQTTENMINFQEVTVKVVSPN